MLKNLNLFGTEEKNNMIQSVKTKFEEIIKILKLDHIIDNEHLAETPMRISKMMVNELFDGCYNNPPDMKAFTCNKESMTPVMVKNITIKSLCAHHFIPFYGNCVIYYLPNNKLCGLSKLSRIASYFSKRPQIQEILTNQIGNYIVEKLEPQQLIVAIRAKHLCMIHRGAEEHESLTDTIFTYSNTPSNMVNNSTLDYVLNSLKDV